MLLWPSSRWICLCSGACVLVLFFFPLVHGPFQATHGPTTAFRGRRALQGIIYSIARAAISVFTAVLAAGSRALCLGQVPARDELQKASAGLPGMAVLRC